MKCPQCGYEEIQVNKKFSHAVHPYVNAETGVLDGMYNTDQEFITIQPKGATKQTKLQRSDKWVPKAAPTPTPAKPVEVAAKK